MEKNYLTDEFYREFKEDRKIVFFNGSMFVDLIGNLKRKEEIII